MTRNDVDMITSKPQIIGPALRPSLHSQTHTATDVKSAPYVVSPASYRISKRLFDISVALISLILFSPLLLLIALAIKLDDGDPVLIAQKRIGLGGKPFRFYKFRSMAVGAAQREDHKAFAQKMIRGEITEGPKSNGGLLKPTGKGRVITRVGKVLRKTSLDELPQLYNILIGDMSLVGPRPSMDYEVEVYKDWYMPRLSVLPGVTGLAQVNGRSSIPFPEIVRWDLRYIETRSFWTDIVIILKTLPVVIGMRHTG
jgi:lipopolysaccharide/colanic/teichoic acid biosynthesis glycosyltransferase